VNKCAAQQSAPGWVCFFVSFIVLLVAIAVYCYYYHCNFGCY